MPLYLYICRTCELETEELYPLGQAPEQGIRCPLCGNYFMRGIALVNIGTGARPVLDRQAVADAPHAANCPCCLPMSRRRSGG